MARLPNYQHCDNVKTGSAFAAPSPDVSGEYNP
jgi:hypothetical protein